MANTKKKDTVIEEEVQDIAVQEAQPVVIEAAVVAESEKVRDCVGKENHKCTIAGTTYVVERDKVIKLPHTVAIVLSNANKIYIK